MKSNLAAFRIRRKTYPMEQIQSIKKNNLIQVKKKKTFNNFKEMDCTPISEIVSDPIIYFKNINPVKLKLFEILISYSKTCRQVFLNQSNLAKMVGVSRVYVNMLLRQLERDGLILSNYRHKRSCVYKISSFFKKKSVRELLAPYVKVLVLLSVSLFTHINLQGQRNKDIIISASGQGSTNYEIPRVKDILERNILIEAIQRGRSHKNPISNSIRTISGLQLTKWGQIKLSVFSDEVIEAAKEEFSYTLGIHTYIRDPFSWFYYACLRYCKVINITPDWSWGKRLELAFKIQPSSPMVTSNTITPVSIKRTINYSIPLPYKTLTAEELENKKIKNLEEKEKIDNTTLDNVPSYLRDVMASFKDRVCNQLTAES